MEPLRVGPISELRPRERAVLAVTTRAFTRMPRFTARVRARREVHGLCFEPVYGARDGQDVAEALATKSERGDKVVFVAAASGHVLQVSYAQRSLLCVLKLHDGPIRGVAATPGYVVTAADDGYVRLWPPGFADFLMEAKHDAPVVSISVAPDGCGWPAGLLEAL